MNKDSIIGALPGLSKPDLEAVLSVAISLSQARTGGLTGQACPTSQLILNALAGAVGLHKGSAGLAEGVQAQFYKRCPKLISFLNDHFTGWDANRNAQLAFLKLLFELLANDLKQQGVEPSLRIMILNLGRVPEVFDNSFPGYREAGIASNVILRHFK